VPTRDERTRFDETGVLRLDGAFTTDEAGAMRGAVWHHAERRTAARRDDPSTWPGPHAINFRGLKRHPAMAAVLAGERMRSALDVAFGSGTWAPPTPGAQVLLTFPSAGPWVLPHGTWHTDFGLARPRWPAAGVKVFAFLDDVAPGGGGTLVLSGTHRLVERFTADLPPDTTTSFVLWRRFLGRHPFLREISCSGEEPARTQRLLGTEQDVDGVPVRVLELTGRPGDVVLTHQDVLHAAAPNVRPTPRLMLGKSVGRTAPERAPLPARGQAITRPPFGEIH
jgi:hypothetical protein